MYLYTQTANINFISVRINHFFNSQLVNSEWGRGAKIFFSFFLRWMNKNRKQPVTREPLVFTHTCCLLTDVITARSETVHHRWRRRPESSGRLISRYPAIDPRAEGTPSGSRPPWPWPAAPWPPCTSCPRWAVLGVGAACAWGYAGSADTGPSWPHPPGSLSSFQCFLFAQLLPLLPACPLGQGSIKAPWTFLDRLGFCDPQRT